MAGPHADDLALALDLAALAAQVALPLWQRGVETQTKSDGSALTEADLAVDVALLTELATRRPADAVLSEESGARGQGSRRWIIDPIDGTSHFARRAESWGTHLALEVDGQLVVGVITRPVLGQCWFASRGSGAYRCPLASRQPATRLAVSSQSEATDARVMLWATSDHPMGSALRQQRRWIPPSIDGLLQIAEGQLDALYDTLGMPWDVAPAVVLIAEAGGKFTDEAGGQRLDSAGRWFSNGHLHDAITRLSAVDTAARC